MKKIIISLLTLILSVSGLFTSTVYASRTNNTVIIDGHRITISNVDGYITAEMIERNTKYQLSHKQFTNSFNLKEKDILSRIANENIYTVNFKSLDGSTIDVSMQNNQTGEMVERPKYQTREAIAIGLGWLALSALAKALMTVAGVIVIGGITYYSVTALSRILREQPTIHYYSAKLHNGNLYIGTPLRTHSQAVSVLKSYGDIIARNREYARSIAVSVSPVRKVLHDRRHTNNAGYLNHFHYYRNNKDVVRHVHAFYQ
ncbi:hypothetical protein KG091_08575 [Carnobacteriaceae bacterium zg-ZUI78]|nr:hypothetical protein [Carnobacteriaceae bacterium zg-ZUI78]